MRFLLPVILGLSFLLTHCGQRIATVPAGPEHVEHAGQTEARAARNSPCREQLNYIPDTAYPSHYYNHLLRVNLHFMDVAPGMHNFSPGEGATFGKALIDACNDRLENNIRMNLPPGNTTPVLPPTYRLKLVPGTQEQGDGVYFHFDEDLYYYIHGRNSNRTSREVIEKYGIGTDTVLNIFLMPHYPDSVSSPGYKAARTGIMLGNGIKLAMSMQDKPTTDSYAGLMNHEIGHFLGLSHTWAGNDGCEDTPTHENCWSYTNKPPCDSLVSNNMMDYNAWQWALTPCQIGRVARNIASEHTRARRFVVQQWCIYHPGDLITITDTIHWQSAKDLLGDVYIADHGVLQVSCRLSFPKGARITIAPKGRLILNQAKLHNACGDTWYGIEVEKSRSASGKLIILGASSVEDALHPLVTGTPDTGSS